MNEPKLRFKADDGNRFPDWEEKTIDEVAECLDNKRVPVNSEERKKRVGIIPYYGAGGIQGYIDDYLFDEELVLLLEDGDAFDDFQTKSIAQYVTGKSWVNNHAHVLRANGNSYFLFASLEHKDIRRWTQLAGASRKKLLKDSMLKITVNMPSLPEQQKIAEFLSTMDTVIDKQKETVSAWEERKKGVMQKLFNQEVRFKADDGSDFPEWEKKKIGDVFDVTRGYVLPVKETREVSDNEYKYPVYSSQTKNNGLMGFYNQKLYENAITWTTDGANAGKTIYRNEEFYCTNVCGVLLDKKGNHNANDCIANMIDTISKKYVSYVGNPKLMNNVMSEIEIDFPCPEEQQKIADCLSSLDEVIEKQKATLAAWEELKKGLLQQMFV